MFFSRLRLPVRKVFAQHQSCSTMRINSPWLDKAKDAAAMASWLFTPKVMVALVLGLEAFAIMKVRTAYRDLEEVKSANQEQILILKTIHKDIESHNMNDWKFVQEKVAEFEQLAPSSKKRSGRLIRVLRDALRDAAVLYDVQAQDELLQEGIEEVIKKTDAGM